MPKAPLRVLGWPAYRNRPYNPYNWLLSTHLVASDPSVVVGEFAPRRLLLEPWDVWHMHWPEKFLRITRRGEVLAKVSALAGLIRYAKARDIRLVWTIHNLISHEQRYPQLEAWLRDWVVNQIDGAIALSATSAKAAQERFPALLERPLAIIPHGHYIGAYPNTISRTEVRASLGLTPEQRVLVFVGQIRTYKNVIKLARCVAELPDPDLRLVIAGLPNDDALATAVRDAVAPDPRMQAHLALIPNDQLQRYLNAADLVVLPYQEILNSGSAILALSFGRPVLVPAKGSMGELQAQFGSPAVMTFEGELTPDTLREALDTLAEQPVDSTQLISEVQQRLDWGNIAAKTVQFYRALCDRPAEMEMGARVEQVTAGAPAMLADD